MQIDVRSPFPFEALPRIWRWIEPFRAQLSNDSSPKTLDEFLAFKAPNWKKRRTWAIYGDGELGGLIEFEKLDSWLGTAHFLLKPEFHRQGLSIKAARIAAADIFEHEGIGKLTFQILAGNLAIGSLLCNLGARREGTLEGHTLRGGKPTDLWVYGLSKETFQGSIRNAVSVL
jgi:RimJ/RimL family protein N-acetyltransferase